MGWQVGQKLQDGKYTLERVLKSSNASITYLAKNQNEQLVIIKTLNNAIQNHPNFVKLQHYFLNEALKLAKASHPHLVKIEELFLEGSLPCLVIEYIEGEDLASQVKNQGILSETEALQYIQQIGEALSVIHDHGFLHQDIKPEQIKLRPHSSKAILIDVAKPQVFRLKQTPNSNPVLIDYYAPIEYYNKPQKLGIPSDIYALAATLYVLLTGYETDPESNQLVPRFPSALQRAAGEPLAEPQHFNSMISNSVNQAILKGMAFLPQERSQSVREWLDLLKENSQAFSHSNSQAVAFNSSTQSTKSNLQPELEVNQSSSSKTPDKADALEWLIGIFVIYIIQGPLLLEVGKLALLSASPGISILGSFIDSSFGRYISETLIVAKFSVIAIIISWVLIWASPWAVELAGYSILVSFAALVLSIVLSSYLGFISDLVLPLIGASILNFFCAGLWMSASEILNNNSTKSQTFLKLAGISFFGGIIGILLGLVLQEFSH